MADDGYLLSRDSVEHLSRTMRSVDTFSEDQGYGYPDGLESDSTMFVEVLALVSDGQYTGAQRTYNSGSSNYSTPFDPFLFNAGTDCGYITEITRSDDVKPGTVVRVFDDVDENGNVAWFFIAPVTDETPTPFCVGAWDVTFSVSVGAGAIEGEINLTTGYSHIYVHRLDADIAWRATWLEQFKIGDIVKVALPASGVGIYFEITGVTLVGDYYDWEINVCDVGNKPLIVTGNEVTVCLGMTCIGGSGVDLDEGPGIQITESPADNFLIKSLVEEGTCMTITQGAAGAAHVFSVDLACVLTYIELNVDWTAVPVTHSIEWQTSPTDALHLVGDEPDGSLDDGYLYGFQAGAKGWEHLRNYFDDTDTIAWQTAVGGGVEGIVQDQMSITSDSNGLKLSGDEATPDDYSVYCKTTGAKGWDGLLNFFVNTGTISWTGGSPSQLQAALNFTADSSVVDNSGVELYGDSSAPGVNKFYGTSNAGAKGWQSFTQVTVVTNVQVDGANNELEKKTQTMYVADPGAESAWTVWHTGTAC